MPLANSSPSKNLALSTQHSDAASRRLTISLADLQQHQRLLVEHDGITVLLLQTPGGQIIALDPTCPHQHVRSLDRGIVNGDSIECPNHGWRFSLQTGKATKGSGCIRLFPVTVTDDTVIVDLPTIQPRWMQY